MWGCGSQTFYSGNWSAAGFFPGMIFPMLIWVLVILVAVRLAIWIYRSLTSDKHISTKDKTDSLVILKARFARGDISEEDFFQMKATLEGQ